MTQLAEETRRTKRVGGLSVTPYFWLIVSVGTLAAISYGAGNEILHTLAEFEDSPTAPILAAVALFALCSFASAYATWRTPLPSFVVAIALGMAGHNLFAPIVAKPTLLASRCRVFLLPGSHFRSSLESRPICLASRLPSLH